MISIAPDAGREDRAAPARLRHVSTDDKGQDPETQLRLLRDYADRRGFTVAGQGSRMRSLW